MGYIFLWILVLIIGASGTLISSNSYRIRREVARGVHEMWSHPASSPPLDLSERSTSQLPPPVLRYLTTVLKRSDPIRTVRLTHRGSMRTSPTGAWIPVAGQQFFAAAQPAFIWWGRVRILPGLWIDAIDSFQNGQGRMLIKAASTWTINDAEGPELSESALLRLLGEMFWFPSALLDQRYVRWEAIDATQARAHIEVAGTKATAIFHFDANGYLFKMTADRYRNVDGHNILTPWTGLAQDYREVESVLVPFAVEAIWNLPEGDFPCIRFSIDTVAFNVDSAF